MSDEKQTAPVQEQTPAQNPAPQEPQTQEPQPEDKPKAQPSYEASAVQEDRSGKSHYKNIGAAFAHRDGKGHTLNLAATPVNGKIVLREPRERLDAKRNAESQARDTQAGRGQDQGQNRERGE